jgi:hypothetical protein
MAGWRKQPVVIAILGVALGIQLGLLYAYQVQPTLHELATVRGMSNWSRSAQLSFGDEFTGYMQFVRKHVPENARVIIPPTNIHSTYGNQGIMQFFLFPRPISNCPNENEASACLKLYSGESTYFLFVDGFPARELIRGERELVSFSEGLGVIMPTR